MALTLYPNLKAIDLWIWSNLNICDIVLRAEIGFDCSATIKDARWPNAGGKGSQELFIHDGVLS